jgi:endo-1,4-beta-xylanase
MINLCKNLTSNIAGYVMVVLILLSINTNAQLVTNGSFENTPIGPVSGTDVVGWVIEIDGTISPAPELSIVDDTVQHGSHALRVIVNAVGVDPWNIQVVADSIPVQQGETYQYSVWAKSSSSSQVTFSTGNYSFAEYGAIRPSAPNVNTGWQQYSLQFTVGDNQTFIRGPIHFSIAANVGDTIYIDKMKIVNIEDVLKPVIVEAESGETGADFTVLQDGDISYVSIQTNLGGNNPGSQRRINTYEITFPDSGTYSLYARVRVGANGFDDDSYFYGNGFGEKDSVTDDDWITLNGLAAAGFSDSIDVVFDAGGLGNGVWKWINLSRNAYQGEAAPIFSIGEDNLTQVFSIGGREDGLDIDKLAFGRADLYYTVKNLDNGEPGSTEIDTTEEWTGPPLASEQPKFVGSIYSGPQVENFEAYWNQVTPENEGKWGSVEGTRDAMNWGGLDVAYNFAKDNGFPFHFHVLIWGAQQPGWINNLSSEEQLEEITEWFEAVAERYPDIDFLEVVNEPLDNHNPPDGTNGRANYKEALGGGGETGWDWVLNAFRMARQIFPPATKLMLNDFSIISSSNSTATYLTIIRLLQAEDLIDIVAEQAHAFTTTAAVTTMRRNLDSLASTGLPIQITEFDIDGPTDQTQLQNYQRIFPALYEHPGVEGITLWGWRPGLWRETANLVTNNGAERPALQWLRNYLDTVNVTVSVETAEAVPQNFQLFNNFPNPFNPTTTISFNLPVRSDIRLQLVDILGRVVKEITAGSYEAGTHQVKLDASNLSSGIYFYKLEAGNFVSTKKLVLMK